MGFRVCYHGWVSIEYTILDVGVLAITGSLIPVPSKIQLSCSFNPFSNWLVFLCCFSYGDKVPSTIAGRVLSIIWILYGTVLVGLTTVSLTMALTTVMVVISTKDVTIYGSRVSKNLCI